MFRLASRAQGAQLTLDRPEARNAIPAEGWRQLSEAIEEVARSDARFLLLAGAGKAFCSGADLDDLAALRNSEGAAKRFRLEMREAIDRLAQIAIPTVAWVDGACYGAGVAIALACDLRVAGPHASFAITPAKIGISYPIDDVRRLVAQIGPGQAARMLFTAGSLDREEAHRIGLAELVEEEAGLDLLIEAIAANAPPSLELLKRSIRAAGGDRSEDGDLDAGFDRLITGDELVRRLEDLGRK